MIDLDTIAELRARNLNQSEKEWVDVLRQPAFNDFSSYLSDGEIEAFVSCFDSSTDLLVASGAFLKGFMEGNDSAYYDFTQIVEGSALSLAQGLDFVCQLEHKERESGKKWLYLQKLDSFKRFLSHNQSYLPGQDISPWLPE